MKKMFLLFTLVTLFTSFLITAQITGSAMKNQIQTNSKIQNIEHSIAKRIQAKKEILTPAQIARAIKIKNRLRIASQGESCPEKCTCTGSVTKCKFANGTRQMTIVSGKSGNMIMQVKGINMSTKVALYKAEDGEFYGVFKNNHTKRIRIMPDEVREKIRKKIRAVLENETIKLDEEGTYQVQARKRARLFGFIPVREKVVTQVDPETGEITRTKTSWWGFLARDIIPSKNAEEESPSVEEITG